MLKLFATMKTMLSQFLYSLLGRQKAIESTNFFDYPAREKKRIIVAAAKRAAKMQEETLRQYEISVSRK